MMTSAPYQSLTSLRAAHRQLLEQRRQHDPGAPDYLEAVRQLIERGAQTGQLLDSEEERWDAQNLLDYWAKHLLRHEQISLDATLRPFDQQQSPELEEHLCPYVGLEAFNSKKQSLFFGRDTIINKMVQQLDKSQLVSVIGSSGSGKSSIVLAGLLPRLHAGAILGSGDWYYCDRVVPGSNPLANLARLFQPPHSDSVSWVAKAVPRFQKDSGYLAHLVRQKMIDQFGAEKTAVFLIDQFEELFTLCRSSSLRHAFIQNLLALLGQPNVRHRLILTMRTDFESSLVQYVEFNTAYENSQHRLTAMNAAQLRDAIEKPADIVGLRFAPGLVDELIREILGEPAALPLLQFTLLKLWEARQRNRVTWEAYEALGGGRQALANVANAVFSSLIPEEQQTAKRILLAIVRPSEGLEVTRDRVLRHALYQTGEAQDRVDRVLQRLIRARLVRLTDGQTPADAQVEIAHEALVRNWPRLVAWLEEERVNRRRRLRLTTMAEQWRTHGMDPSTHLRGLLLEEALRYDDLNDLERNYVEASLSAADEARRIREANQERKLAEERRRAQESENAARRFARLAYALAIVIFLAVGAAMLAINNSRAAAEARDRAEIEQQRAEQSAFVALTAEADAAAQRDEAESQRDAAIAAQQEAVAAQATANTARADAESALAAADAARLEAEKNALEADVQSRLATSRELAAAALDQLTSNPQLALLLAVESVNITQPISLTHAPPAEAQDALFRTLQTAQLQQTLAGHTDWVSDVTFGPNDMLLTSSLDGTVKLWQPESGEASWTIREQAGSINAVAVRPDSDEFATVGEDGLTYLWNASAQRRLLQLTSDGSPLRDVAFSPNGRLVATGSDSGLVRVWQLFPTESLLTLLTDGQPILAVAFSPDGRWLAGAGESGQITIWDSATGTASFTFEARSNASGEPIAISSLAFSPDSSQLLAGRSNGTAALWDLEARRTIFTLSGHASFVTDVAFHPMLPIFATASRDGTAKVWQAETGQPRYTLTGHAGGLLALAFARDGDRLATASQDGTVKVWNALPALPVQTFAAHTADVTALALSANGRLLATASQDQTANLWDIEAGELLHRLQDHNGSLTNVAFAPNGEQVATASIDFNVRLWEVASGEVTVPLLSHPGAVTGLAYSPDGKLLATANQDGIARLWNPISRTVTLRLNHDFPLMALAFSPDGEQLGTVTSNGTVSLWQLGKPDAPTLLLPHPNSVNALAFSTDGKRLATASSSGVVRLWSLPAGELLATLQGHGGSVEDVAFSPDGQQLATVSADRTARLWDLATEQTIRTFIGHTATLFGVAFSENGRLLATASADRTVRLQPLSTIDELFAQAVALLPRSLTSDECARYLHGRPCFNHKP